jgi:uncharacterized protein (TIGR03437 family)
VGILHANSRDPVSYSDPSHPGEVVAAFLTGLGPVSPPAVTGQPAPLNGTSHLQLPFNCVWEDFTASYQFRTLPAIVLFAGLAPGLTGVYQVNVEVPTNITVERSSTSASLLCTSTLPSGAAASSSSVVPLERANPSPGKRGRARIELNGP